MTTKQRLIDGALDLIRTQGITAVSARSVGAAAGVNQSLIFYHFGSVEELLAQACLSATEARVATHRERFAGVTTLGDLLAAGQAVHDGERAEGNLTVLAQALAGAQSSERLAEATRAALALWTTEVESALVRVLAGSPLAEVADAPGLARAASASFLGLTLWDSVDPDGGAAALTALTRLAVLADVLDDLGPLATRAVRARLRTAAKARPTNG
ncbi:TetR/AcrR family transcriptional regulator [Actinokineospora bangkokensis]|uniref:TetR family transcriptional regulator n=1 Tax=Actinokineospora bangkokensis TaxID=1193682 RepID=A0A1Q9LK58_9PSEU|nr:TetR/AcrR family transcriptional regulator [Actinokineospora bangkokensis]OLR92431.1 TetR family transcriptional regulator [Actinokineospora bangkokensis]